MRRLDGFSQQQMPQQHLVIRLCVSEPGNASLGNHQYMYWRLRADVVDRNTVLILVNKLARNITADNFAKDGVKKLSVVTPAFVSDCLETLEEIGMEAKDSFLENGGSEFATIPCLNDNDAWVKTIANWVNDWTRN